MFCKHEWQMISETTTESKFESSMEAMKNAGVSSIKTLPHQLCDGKRKHIQAFVCKKCGKLKRFVETI